MDLPQNGRSLTAAEWTRFTLWSTLNTGNVASIRKGKVLFLIKDLEGFTSNLQFLVAASEDFCNHEVTLGFLVSEVDKGIQLGSESDGTLSWVFYSLHLLVKMLLGEQEWSLKYKKLTLLLFVAQMQRLT